MKPTGKNKKSIRPRILFGLCLIAGYPLAAAEGEHDHDAHEADAHDHAGHSHDAHHGHDHDEEKAHAEPDVVDHSDHDHEADAEGHSGHDHDQEGEGEEGIELSDEMMKKAGIKIQQAEKGGVSRISTFPAEIKLNRNLSAAVRPSFRSQVIEVFGEIGDEVKKGRKLAVLKNMETLAEYSVSAPGDGVIIFKDASIGEIADESSVLYEVADLSSVWAEISIFPQYQHVVKKGMRVSFVAHDGHRAEGVLQYISPIASHETRTFTARSVLENPPEDFTPGVFVRARIPVQEVDANVTVPPAAVQRLDGETVVFVPGEHGFTAVPVRIGVRDEDRVEILSGLEPGQAYVAAGAFVLKSQMVIRGMDPHAGHGH